MIFSRRLLPFIALGVIIGALLTAGLKQSGELELRLTLLKTQRPLLVLPMKPEERFTVHYFHSVENAPIWEEHSVDENGLIYIEEERYEKFGAGMGKMPGVGRMVRRGQYEVIEDMHMLVGDFILRIGSPGVDHTIIWRGIKKNLSLVAPHEAVQFTAKPVSILYKYWRQFVPHPATPRTETNHDI